MRRKTPWQFGLLRNHFLQMLPHIDNRECREEQIGCIFAEMLNDPVIYSGLALW